MCWSVIQLVTALEGVVVGRNLFTQMREPGATRLKNQPQHQALASILHHFPITGYLSVYWPF